MSEQRTATVEVEEVKAEGRTLHGFAALYGVESRKLEGGFTEVIQPGAFSAVLEGEPDVYLTFNHSPDKVLARTSSGTLKLRDEDRGLAFEAELGDGPTAQDVREMVRRGDVTGASFRFRVAPDGEEWEGSERRTLTRIESLSDISLATVPAYDGPRVEIRSTNPDPEQEADTMPTDNEGAGGLQVEDRPAEERHDGATTLADEFRAAGFDGDTPATIPFETFESRAVTLHAGTTVESLAPRGAASVALGADQRYAWPVFPSSPVDEGTTSVEVLRQRSRTLPDAEDVIRDLAAVTEKPEVGSVLELVSEPLKQVAAKQSGIPNVYLAQPAVGPIINTDLRLAVNEGLDKLVLDEVAAAPNYDPADSDTLLIAIRHAIGLIQDAGYNPDTLILAARGCRVPRHLAGDARGDSRRGGVRVQPRPSSPGKAQGRDGGVCLVGTAGFTFSPCRAVARPARSCENDRGEYRGEYSTASSGPGAAPGDPPREPAEGLHAEPPQGLQEQGPVAQVRRRSKAPPLLPREGPRDQGRQDRALQKVA
jgi:uncharacterized protein